jgi:hypothetical protein
MSDEISPYGTHEHASPDAVHTHAIVGEPARLATLDQAIEGTSRAAFSTAPYIPPKVKPADGDDTQLNSRTTTRAAGPGATSGSAAAPPAEPVFESALCKYKNCRAARVPGFQYCERHPPLSEDR